MVSVDQIGAYHVLLPQRQPKLAGHLPQNKPVVKPLSGNGEAVPKVSQKELVAPPIAESLKELAVKLSKVNPSFDLFEIQAKVSIDETTGGILIRVINNKTGEEIMKIPPYQAIALISDKGAAAGLLLDREV